MDKCLRQERGTNEQLRMRVEDLNKVVGEQQECIGVLTEERDNARDKEEEYWQRLQERMDAEERVISCESENRNPWAEYLGTSLTSSPWQLQKQPQRRLKDERSKVYISQRSLK